MVKTAQWLRRRTRKHDGPFPLPLTTAGAALIAPDPYLK